MKRLSLFALVALFLSCSPHKAPAPPPGPTRYFTATRADSRFYVADHMLASIEMQISGEPFAQLLGRNLSGFNRFNPVTDQYTDPTTMQTVTDVLGYATGVESYEYSKQPMNNLSFESGAGLSLQYGPLVNPSNVNGDPAYILLVDRLQHFADLSHAGGAKNFVVSPPPPNNPLNPYGWPGYWPQIAEFRSFDPTIHPPGGATKGCTFVGGYAATSMGSQVVADYECGYNGLNLPNRDAQVDKVLAPDALGYALWKQALWVINYWQSLHDIAGNPIIQVADADLAQVGVPGNTVVGQYPDPADPSGKSMVAGQPGTYFGDITLEGWQGLTMLEEMNEKAALLLTRLTTDGGALGGFASTKEAIDYGYQSPLRWFPAAVRVTEQTTAPSPDLADKYFPQPSSFTLTDASSRLTDLSALAGGFATYFALTDFGNPDVGATVSSRATFDGDPFAADDQLPDGEETPHDRALALVKVAVIDADRLHFDPAHQVLVDEVKVVGGQIVRGTTVTTRTAAYAIVGLRTALRSISSTLALYSNDTPDTQGAPTVLDAAPLAGAPTPLAARLVALIRAEGDFLADRLTTPDGAVANGFDLASGKPDPSPTKIESEASAIRGLLDAYLATSDEKYRSAAQRIYADLTKRFWMEDVRAYRTTAGVSDTMTWTPVAFGSLEAALRQYWKLVARRPGQERAASDLLTRFARTFKLVVNGWDDANANDRVEYPAECTGAGLQMAERSLTGELGRPSDGGDRDRDCVHEVSQVGLPSALAAQIVIKRAQ